MMSMADHIAIGVEKIRIDSGCSLEKEFTELIRMNPWMVFDKSFKRCKYYVNVLGFIELIQCDLS